jgi:hypothetical protein
MITNSQREWLHCPPDHFFLRFESLGNNCEFGIVQRKAGVDPPGLFRNVGFLDVRQVVRALSSGLAGMFEDGNFAYEVRSGWRDYTLQCFVSGFTFHSGISIELKQTGSEWTAAIDKNVASFRFLRRKLLADLQTGEKLFVYRDKRRLTDPEVRALHAAIAAHGPGWLLCVCEDHDVLPGKVELLEPGMVRGWTSRLSNENPPQIDLEAWSEMARQSLALRFGDNGMLRGWRSPGADTRLRGMPGPVPSSPVLEHRFEGPASLERPGFFYLIRGGKSGQTYLASAWGNIPSSAKLTDLGIVFFGQKSLRFVKADLAIRDRWQPLSVQCRLEGPSDILVPSLSVSAPGELTLYTAGWDFGTYDSLAARSCRSDNSDPGISPDHGPASATTSVLSSSPGPVELGESGKPNPLPPAPPSCPEVAPHALRSFLLRPFGFRRTDP